MGILTPGPNLERIDLANAPDFDLGLMRVKPSERSVEAEGMRRELQPRVMQVLVALAQARPAVVSRDKLVAQCWDGRIVGDDALNRCILALRHLADEIKPQPFAIETVPRIGHRLVEAPSSHALSPASPGTRKSWASWLAILVLVLVAATFIVWQRRSAEPEPTSIAVLPFRNVSGGDAHFAEGVSEEILSQLAREPAFRVAGRGSAAQFEPLSDPRVVGKKLGVDYILEGSVRTEGGRVRINASLVKSSDGMRLWSETFDRKLEDVLGIQTAIGQAVANGLSLRLVGNGSRGTRPINGEAYALYLNARGLLRSQNPQVGGEAVAYLRQAIRLDPKYAPVWSSLADAIQLEAKVKGADSLIEALPRAQSAARRALQLDPNLAQAHGVLGQLLPIRDAGVHLRRAAALDPRSGEGLTWLSEAHYVSGEYVQWQATIRRAHEIDPLWTFPLRALIDVTSVMDDRKATEALVRRSFPDDLPVQHFALGRVAWTYGDFSEAARHWSFVAKDPESRFAPPAKNSLQDLAYSLGLSRTPPSRPPTPRPGRLRWGPGVWMTAPPSAAEWRHRNRSPAAALVNLDENIVAAKLMLNAGRGAELVATYDSPVGLLNMTDGQPVTVCIEEAAIAALALRNVGRTGEADALLRQADEALRVLYRRGRVPSWLHWEAASVWALQGKSGPAVAALDRSLRLGWGQGRRGTLRTIAEEPAFQGLRGVPRFRQVLGTYEAGLRRERQETALEIKLPV